MTLSPDQSAAANRPRMMFVGGSGHHYLRGLLPDRAVGLCLSDPHEPVASRDWAARHEVDLAELSFGEAVQQFRPDVVSIGAVFNHNGPYVIDALQAGLPVVCDKPIAVTADMLDEISRLASAEGAPPLVTEFDWRSRAELRAAKAVIEAGRIGPVVLAIGQKSYRFGQRPQWYADPQHYSGTMHWVASHVLDAMAFVCGGMPRVISARGGNVSRPAYGSMEDHVTAILALPGGGTGVVHADLLNPAASPTHGKDRLRIVGGSGELLLEGGRCILTTDDQGPHDVTEEGEPAPSFAERLLVAVQRHSRDPDFNTNASLASARLMLSAADRMNQH